MAEVITARLSEEINKDLDIIARKENLDRSTIMRRLLKSSLLQWRRKYAVNMYKHGKYSTEQASRFARLNLWDFFELLRKEKVSISYDLEELEKDVENVL